jgi:hypothetical protein
VLTCTASLRKGLWQQSSLASIAYNDGSTPIHSDAGRPCSAIST